MADGLVQVAPDSTGKKVDTSELTVGANTVERQRIVIADPTTAAAIAPVSATTGLSVNVTNATVGVTGAFWQATQPVSGTFWQATQPISGSVKVNASGSDTTLCRGRVSTFRTPGRAGTTGQKIMAIHNATGSTVTAFVTGIAVDLSQTVVKAITVIPPVVRAWKVTVLPSNGTALTKVQINGTSSSSASVTVWGDASADGTGSGTALTATLPAGTILTQEFAPRFITAAGYEPADRIEFFSDGTEVRLNALEGIVLFLDYTLATANPTTDMWVATLEWYEV